MSDSRPTPRSDDPRPEPRGGFRTAEGVQVHAVVAPPVQAPGEKIRAAFPIISEERAKRRALIAAPRHRTPAEKTESARSDGRTGQSSLLVPVPVRPGQYDALAKLLNGLKALRCLSRLD